MIRSIDIQLEVDDKINGTSSWKWIIRSMGPPAGSGLYDQWDLQLQVDVKINGISS